MTTVGEKTEKVYKQVRLDRNAFMMAAHFFDVHVGEDGIHAYFMWKRNDFRFPIFHHLTDMLKRNRRSGKLIDEAISSDEKSIYMPYESIQGLVTYRDHKEIQMLSTQEQVYFIFRDFDNYDEFVETLKEKLPEKYFTRDDIDIEDSVHIS